MNFLTKFKTQIIGGGIIIALLLLANHYENNGIRESEATKWKDAIANAKPVEVSRDTTRTPQPEIKGGAKSERKFDWWKGRSKIDSMVGYNSKKIPEVPNFSPMDSLDYYRWLANEYSVEVKDSTSGAHLEMTAKPRESSISYVLKLPPKEQINTRIENQVLIPPIEKNWTFGLEAGYFNEARLGVGIGVKPISVWADYHPQSTGNKWGGHIQFQWEL